MRFGMRVLMRRGGQLYILDAMRNQIINAFHPLFFASSALHPLLLGLSAVV